MSTARIAPDPPRWTIFGPTPEYKPAMPRSPQSFVVTAMKGPGLNALINEGRGMAGSNVIANLP